MHTLLLLGLFYHHGILYKVVANVLCIKERPLTPEHCICIMPFVYNWLPSPTVAFVAMWINLALAISVRGGFSFVG